ncbi:sulfatase-like hydrolase/transferase [Leptospira sp. 201903070]|uniref:Sulfatase-like hydrolase/transferase n=1 Tax=Leptospira ainlahdjerensis TaxID=2810033 RepID=A0ABS2UEK2_9LEPT|nr:sulfatase-like hydrolase/transferase [Leptospira ainlahdjerensis]MBM9578816.1 sulfatase-like hydrolase/transferase [Leptospira ainlahdjerensis]
MFSLFKKKWNVFVSDFQFKIVTIFILPSLILLSDLIIRWKIVSQMERLQWSYYLLSFFYSILIYSFLLLTLNLFLSFSKKRYYWGFLVYISLGYTICIVGSYGYYLYSGIMPNFFVFSYMFQEPFNSWTIFRGGLTFGSLIGFILLFLFLFVTLKIASSFQKPSRFLKSRFASLAVVILLFAAFFHNNTRFNDQIYVSDANSISFINRNLYNILTGDRLGSAGLQSRNKPFLNPSSNSPKMNLLVILSESLRRKNMGLYGYERDTTPFLDRWSKNSGNGSVVVFKNAFSNSSSTLISVPSLLSGVSPIQPVSLTHSAPLFWEYGQAAGLSTFYISSHSFRWNNFSGFFKNAGIDFLWNKEISGYSVFNDIGIDDRKTVEEFQLHVKDLKKKKRNFAGVLHLNTNHFPYIIPEESIVFPIGKDAYAPYDNSVHYLDELLRNVFQFLQQEELTKNTLVIFTSDHGEGIFEHDYIGHIESNHIETVAIPMVFFVPDSLKKTVPIDRLKKNAERNVSNTDLIPTVADILEVSNQPEVKGYLSKLEGRSLFSNLPDDRRIFIANNNETSLYRVGMSYIQGNLHYMLRLNAFPPDEEAYDIQVDPNEKNNLWSSFSSEKKKEIRKQLEACSLCQDLYSTSGIKL